MDGAEPLIRCLGPFFDVLGRLDRRLLDRPDNILGDMRRGLLQSGWLGWRGGLDYRLISRSVGRFDQPLFRLLHSDRLDHCRRLGIMRPKIWRRRPGSYGAMSKRQLL